MAETVNVAARLVAMARAMPDATAVAMPLGYGRDGSRRYRSVTFQELDRDSDRLAHGFGELGVRPGSRLALLVKPGIDFIALVFALFKAGAVCVLVDPGMGPGNLVHCLEEVEPEGFVAIPPVHAVRSLLGRRFPRARINVTVGRRWFWGGTTLSRLRRAAWRGGVLAATSADDPAAVIFTSGSTGPPKGVLYRHENFDRQVTEIRDFFQIRPGEVDLAAFPLFGLFNSAMGVTTVIPDMEASRPARVDPAKIVEAIRDWSVTQAFGSPAVWSRVGPYCAQHGIRLPTLRRVLAAGAPVPPGVLECMQAVMHPEGDVHTPYGATEALPVASIAGREVLAETAQRTRQGAGTCVGRKFPGIEWKVIRAADGPLGALAEAQELPTGRIGELIVRGAVVTREYVTRVESNARAKITDGETTWHRMGDVGYVDAQGRFWYCGRLAHRVLAAQGPMYTEQCEAILNSHPAVSRSALVGVGPPGAQRPVIICEPLPGRMPRGRAARRAFLGELAKLAQSNPLTATVGDFLLHPSFPVDIRHNAKIFREKLARWAARKLRDG